MKCAIVFNATVWPFTTTKVISRKLIRIAPDLLKRDKDQTEWSEKE